MKSFRKILYAALVMLTTFLALTGVLGGLALVADFNAPPVEQLQGSIFVDFTVPGLALFLLVGGSALLAALLLIRKSTYGVLCAASAGIIIMFFEFVEVLIIGSPVGIARTLQIFYFGLGTLIEIFSMGVWYLDLLSPRTSEQPRWSSLHPESPGLPR